MVVATPIAQDDDGRDESPNQRMDRNWTELLKEVRVTQMGVQILGAFLLTLAFQAQVSDPAAKPFPAAARR
jgi:hypothetical protein